MKYRIISLLLSAMIMMSILSGCSDGAGKTDSTVESETNSNTADKTDGTAEGETESKKDAETTADFAVFDTDMQEVRLSDFFGRPIVVNFWATWCPPCRSELPAFDAMYEKYGGDVVFLMVDLTDGVYDTADGVNSFIAECGYAFPVYYDIGSSAAVAYDITSIPQTLFITADGSLYYTKIGAMNEETLETYIKLIIANN